MQSACRVGKCLRDGSESLAIMDQARRWRFPSRRPREWWSYDLAANIPMLPLDVPLGRVATMENVLAFGDEDPATEIPRVLDNTCRLRNPSLIGLACDTCDGRTGTSRTICEAPEESGVGCLNLHSGYAILCVVDHDIRTYVFGTKGFGITTFTGPR